MMIQPSGQTKVYQFYLFLKKKHIENSKKVVLSVSPYSHHVYSSSWCWQVWDPGGQFDCHGCSWEPSQSPSQTACTSPPSRCNSWGRFLRTDLLPLYDMKSEIDKIYLNQGCIEALHFCPKEWTKMYLLSARTGVQTVCLHLEWEEWKFLGLA